jgi:hypothetical protein
MVQKDGEIMQRILITSELYKEYYIMGPTVWVNMVMQLTNSFLGIYFMTLVSSSYCRVSHGGVTGE